MSNLLALVSFCMLLHVSASSAQEDTMLTATAEIRQQVFDLTPYTQLIVDSSNAFSLDDVVQLSGTGHTHRLAAFSSSYSPQFTYWLHVRVPALTPSRPYHLIVKTGRDGYDYYAQWDEMTVYQVGEDGKVLDTQHSGIHVPRSEKRLTIPAGLTAAMVGAQPDSTRDLYVRLKNYFGSATDLKTTLELREPSIDLPANYYVTLFTVLSAIAFVLSFLALFFYLFTGSNSYLFFFLYLVFLGAHYLILHPKIPFTNVLIPEAPWLTSHFFVALAFGSMVMFMLFGRHFINLAVLSPKTDRWLKVTIGIWVLYIAVEIACMILLKRSVLNSFSFIVPASALVFLVRFAFFKNTLARIFVVGAGWLLLFSLMGMLIADQLFAIGINPWPIGQVGQILIYMAGLAYQIRQNERQHAEAKRIQEMGDIKSRFFANISHEFRTPLTLIRGLLQQINLAQQGKADAIMLQPRQLQTMQRNADRLLELVNQLLDLSRLDSGKMKLQISKGDVLQILRTLVHAFDSMAERKQIHYQVYFPEHTPMAYFDKDKLEKIITNLLSNAFKYTPERGRIAVHVELQEGRLRFSVADSGPGIARKELDKVFDRFYQSEGNEDKGSGIGLALVKELVDLYKGQISISSEPGRGTQFRVSLPIDRSAFDQQEMVYDASAEDESLITGNTQTSDMSATTALRPLLPLLLIVEDNADLRQFIRESLASSFQIDEATNGEDGLEKATAQIPDLIISDVMMPRMNGFAMSAKLKKDERTSHIPIILLTAKADQANKMEGLETGADDYLTKPFDVRELQVRAQNLIQQRNLLRQKFAGTIHLKPTEMVAESLDVQFLSRIMQAIEAHMHDEEFGVEALAKAVAMSRSQLHRKMVALLDRSPSDLIRQTRLVRARELLQQRAASPAEVAFKVGFNSHSYFSKCFKEEFGVSPSEA